MAQYQKFVLQTGQLLAEAQMRLRRLEEVHLRRPMFCQSKAGLIRNADLEMEVVPFLFLYLKVVTFDGRPAPAGLGLV